MPFLPQRPGPGRRHQHLQHHREVGIEGAAEADHHFTRPRGAHRHVEREHQRMTAGGLRAPHQIEADGVVVLGGAIELEPEHVGRELGDALDGRAADRPERIGNAGALRGAGEIFIGARPYDRRPAHRRNADRRGVAAAEQFDLAWRQRRHHAIARHQFHRIEPRPIAPDAGIVLAGAAVGIFEGKMRQPAARAAAQIVDGRIMPVKLGVARIGVLADVRLCLRRGSLRRGNGRRIVHGRFSWPPL